MILTNEDIRPFFGTPIGNGSIMINGSYALFYVLENPPHSTLDDKDYDEINDLFYNVYQLMPENSFMQVQGLYIKQGFDASYMPDFTFLQNSRKAYYHDKDFLNHYSFLCFILPDLPSLHEDYINSRKKDWSKIITDENKIEAFKERITKIVGMVDDSQFFSINPLEGEDLESTLTLYDNAFITHKTSDLILDDTIKSGDTHYKIYTIPNAKCMPEEVGSSEVDYKVKPTKGSFKGVGFVKGYMDEFAINLHENHIYNQTIYKIDSDKFIDNIDRRLGKLEGDANFLRINKEKSEAFKKDFEGVVSHRETNQMVLCNVSLIVWGQKEEIKRIDNNLTKDFTTKGIRYYEPIIKSSNVFLSSKLGLVASLYEKFFMEIPVRSALSLFSLTGNFKGNKQGIEVNDALNTMPLTIDTWKGIYTPIEAPHYWIVAKTGSGKSVISNAMFTQYYELGYYIVIIDLGKSYQKSAYLNPDAVFIEITEESPLGINPFFIQDISELTPSKVKSLADIMIKIWKRKDFDQFKNETIAMRKIIRSYYTHHKENHSFQSFYRFIQSNKNTLLSQLDIESRFFDIGEFLLSCEEFLPGETYGKVFSDVDIELSLKIKSSRWIIFELDKIKSDPFLLSIVVMVLKETIENTILQDESKRGYVHFDEFAESLEFEDILSTVAHYFQKMRKKQAAVGIVIQDPSQLPENRHVNNIKSNTFLYFILYGTEYKGIAEYLDLSDKAYNQLMTNKKHYGRSVSFEESYNQFTIIEEGKAIPVRLQLSKEEFLAYQTDGEHNAKLMENFKAFGDMKEAIRNYINQGKI